MRYWILFSVLIISLSQCKRKSDNKISQLIKQGAKIVDVRTPEEFDSGAYPGAVNIPVTQVASRITEFGPRDKAIIVYCASGLRSLRAMTILEAAGYTNVVNAGGLRSMPEH